ncbi:MAG: hypothetical protein ABF292_14060 [Desulfobacterales bacterium]
MNDQNATRGNFGAQAVGYRIFLASPGDVRDEGELARAVIEQIRLERAFRERVNLEIIAWDQPGGGGGHGGRSHPSGGDQKGAAPALRVRSGCRHPLVPHGHCVAG